MKLILLLAALVSTGCPRAVQRPVRIIASTPAYVVGEQSPTKYIIWASGATEAQRVADSHLCKAKGRVCTIYSMGVVFGVERPLDDQQQKDK